MPPPDSQAVAPLAVWAVPNPSTNHQLHSAMHHQQSIDPARTPSLLGLSRTAIEFTTALALALLLLPTFAPAQDNTITGTLRVTGDSDFEGNLATFGSWAGDPSHAGLILSYGDAPTSGSLVLGLNRPEGTFTWSHLNADGSAWVQGMRLDGAHKLKLNPGSATQFVELNPAGTSFFTGSIDVGGNDSTMNAQTITGSGSILTAGLGDARYVRTGATLTWGADSTATTASSISLGEAANAIGGFSSPGIALGKNARAQTSLWGPYSGIAMGTNATVGAAGDVGGGVAIGNYAYTKCHGIALGENLQALAYQAVAIGLSNLSVGQHSVTLGANNRTYGFGSRALGNDLWAYGYQETVVGSMNVIEPNANQNARVETENCFVVGNGSGFNGVGTRSNAFTIKWNGDATMYGNATVTKKLTVEQGAKVSGTLRIEPRGGLSMGEFTYDPENQ